MIAEKEKGGGEMNCYGCGEACPAPEAAACVRRTKEGTVVLCESCCPNLDAFEVVDLVLEIKHLRQVARQIVDLQEIQDKRALEQFHLSSDAFLNMLEGVAAKAAWVIGKYGNESK